MHRKYDKINNETTLSIVERFQAQPKVLPLVYKKSKMVSLKGIVYERYKNTNVKRVILTPCQWSQCEFAKQIIQNSF